MGNEISPESGDNNNDFEFEVHPLSWAGAGSRRWRRIAAGIAIALAMVLAFELALNGPSASSTAQSSSPTPHVTATTPSLPPQPSSTPPTSALKPVPSTCSAASSIDTAALAEMNYYATPAFGSSPIWMLGLGSDPTYHVVHFVETYPPLIYTANGWRWRILLVSAPGYTKDLTLSGEETGGAKTASLYMDAGRGLAAKLVLNASRPIMRGVAWAEWPIYVYLPKAGCYQLAAQWQGGGWSIYFAAGA